MGNGEVRQIASGIKAVSVVYNIYDIMDKHVAYFCIV